MLEDLGSYDKFVLGFIFLTTAFGFVRGLSGEILSFLRLFGASLISFITSNAIRTSILAEQSNIVSGIVMSVTSVIIFILSNIILGIFLYPIVEFVRAMLPRIIDKFLGVIIAFIKNFLIIIVIHTILTQFIPYVLKNELEITKNSKVSEYLNPISEVFVGILLSNEKIKDKFDKIDSGKNFMEGIENFKNNPSNLFESDKNKKDSDDNSEKEGVFDQLQNLYKNLNKKSEVSESSKNESPQEEPKDSDDNSSFQIDKFQDLIDSLNN